MKLTESQLLAIQQKLNYAVKYQESYDELYDHVLSTLENTEGEYSDGLVDQIIERGFGGYHSLKATEEDRAKLVNRDMRKKHGHHMAQFFNVPMIGLTLILVIAAYLLASNPNMRKGLIAVSTGASIAPLLFLFYKRLSARFKQQRYDIYRKPSLKDNYIFIAAILGNSLFSLANAGNNQIVANGGITMFVFVFYVIYVFSFFKLYRDEFKMNIAR